MSIRTNLPGKNKSRIYTCVSTYNITVWTSILISKKRTCRLIMERNFLVNFWNLNPSAAQKASWNIEGVEPGNQEGPG